MQAQLDRGHVIAANAQFWSQMLAMELNPMVFIDQFCMDKNHLHASVAVIGEWQGRIEVRMAEGLAYTATSTMLMQSVEDTSAADTLDAVKEIANMIGGVLKSSLPQPCTMTVPDSIVEVEGFCSLGQTSDSLVVAFRHASGDLMVRIWEEAA